MVTNAMISVKSNVYARYNKNGKPSSWQRELYLMEKQFFAVSKGLGSAEQFIDKYKNYGVAQ